MIKSLHGSKTEIHPKSVEACLILQNYFEDELIKTFGADKRVSTHERFCKSYFKLLQQQGNRQDT